MYIIYNSQDGEFHISGSDQACCVRPSRVPVGVRVLLIFNAGRFSETSSQQVLIVLDSILLRIWMQIGT